MIEVGQVQSVQPIARANPDVWIGGDGSVGATAGSPPVSVSSSPSGWRVGYRFPGPEVEVEIGEGDLVAQSGSSLYIGYEPGGFLQSAVTVDTNFVDFKAYVEGGQVNGQSGTYIRFKPGMVLVATVAVGIIVLSPWPDELGIPALLEGTRRLFEGIGG